MATRGAELGRCCVRLGARVCCDVCLSYTALIIIASALLHPDRLSQQSCSSAVSMLFSALDRPMDHDMSVQVPNLN
jgi:hypothetical protein